MTVTTLGTGEAFLALHAATGEKGYFNFCTGESMGARRKIHTMPLYEWDQPIQTAEEIEKALRTAEDATGSSSRPLPEELDNGGPLTCHMYRIFARCIEQLRLYRVDRKENLLVMARRAMEQLTRRVSGGMVITGTCSIGEQWSENQDGAGRLGETCVTVHLLFLLDELMRLEGDIRHGDIMERSIFNALFGAQSPDGRRLRYFTPFSGVREYFDPDTYCCPGNYRRGIGRLPSMVYYRLTGDRPIRSSSTCPCCGVL